MGRVKQKKTQKYRVFQYIRKEHLCQTLKNPIHPFSFLKSISLNSFLHYPNEGGVSNPCPKRLGPTFSEIFAKKKRRECPKFMKWGRGSGTIYTMSKSQQMLYMDNFQTVIKTAVIFNLLLYQHKYCLRLSSWYFIGWEIGYKYYIGII